MKKTAWLCLCAAVFFSSCASTPTTPAQPTEPDLARPDEPTSSNQTPLTPTKDDDIIIRFDTVAITKATFETTKNEMETVVEELNRITFNRDYDRWLTWLSEEYYREFSNKDTLETVSASLPTKGLRLRNLKDYFTYVFVPS